MNMASRPAPRELLRGALALVYPRRCPFCGRLIDGGECTLFCRACAPAEEELRHLPPRLPETEHCFTELLGAAGAYFYRGAAASAVLRAKNGGSPWYAQELADLIAVRVLEAKPPRFPGAKPQYRPVPGLPLYDRIVAVPPRRGRGRGNDLPGAMAARLGGVLGIPVSAALETVRDTAPQKGLTLQNRLRNRRGAYAVKRGIVLTGERILLLDDVITTGATVSACAAALMAGGAESVFAVCAAADEF